MIENDTVEPAALTTLSSQRSRSRCLAVLGSVKAASSSLQAVVASDKSSTGPSELRWIAVLSFIEEDVAAIPLTAFRVPGAQRILYTRSIVRLGRAVNVVLCLFSCDSG